jgi:hypothetical protein
VDTDGLSGTDACDADVVLTADGTGQSASGTCTDLAGNVSIWDVDDGDTVVYDNQMGSDNGYDGTAIGGGNIKVHNK